jgi:ketosteroid isomerase-like protein
VRIYVSGPTADTAEVRRVQHAVLSAGHELTLDWSDDVSSGEDYAARPERSARIARDGLDAVLAAEAVLVVATEHDGRGTFVELGAALARARRGELAHVVLIGEVRHESVFHFHPAVQRVRTVGDWLAGLG